jgi:nucleotide-binding universal stress UspA family protein
MHEMPLGSIGVGFDGGPESRQALAVASALAERADARLELLCAVPGAVLSRAPRSRTAGSSIPVWTLRI